MFYRSVLQSKLMVPSVEKSMVSLNPDQSLTYEKVHMKNFTSFICAFHEINCDSSSLFEFLRHVWISSSISHSVDILEMVVANNLNLLLASEFLKKYADAFYVVFSFWMFTQPEVEMRGSKDFDKFKIG
eukprot:UN28494